MSAAMGRIVTLLRSVNVGGNRKLAMAELRVALEDGGLADVATYIQSGNIVCAGSSAAKVEKAIEAILEKHAGAPIEAMSRTASVWAAYVDDFPMASEAKDAPARTFLLIAKHKPAAGAADAVAERARDGERIAAFADALAIHYPTGAGQSRLTPTLFDRLVGSTTTQRNWNTALKLREMAEG
jgi:uncharacterized protein (DUF1697 family)